uniref:Uncharacterized protein n=1 Tax=Knipowitschia caucasica TaxID=637954 RepID=A0AAV2KSR0_KNICA
MPSIKRSLMELELLLEVCAARVHQDQDCRGQVRPGEHRLLWRLTQCGVGGAAGGEASGSLILLLCSCRCEAPEWLLEPQCSCRGCVLMLCVFTGPSAAEASRDPKELLLWTEDCRGVCAAVTQGPPEVPLPQGPPGASEHGRLWLQ